MRSYSLCCECCLNCSHLVSFLLGANQRNRLFLDRNKSFDSHSLHIFNYSYTNGPLFFPVANLCSTLLSLLFHSQSKNSTVELFIPSIATYSRIWRLECMMWYGTVSRWKEKSHTHCDCKQFENPRALSLFCSRWVWFWVKPSSWIVNIFSNNSFQCKRLYLWKSGWDRSWMALFIG